MTLTAVEEADVSVNKIEDMLKTLVVYSDHAAASKAMTVQHRVLRQFAAGGQLRTAWWAAESLKNEVWFEASCRHADEADLVFIALTISGELPREVKAWLAKVLTRNYKPDLALVVLLGTTENLPAEVNMLDTYLYMQTRNAGIDCFIYWHQQKTSLETDFIPNQHHALACAPAFSSMMANQAGEPRWGLNE